jgi:hypothetical protein
MREAIRQWGRTGGQPVTGPQGVAQGEMHVVQTHHEEKMMLVRLLALSLAT